MAKSEEKRKNCLNCNKSLKRIAWYYRNGGYFCNLTCSKEHAKKKQEEPSK